MAGGCGEGENTNLNLENFSMAGQEWILPSNRGSDYSILQHEGEAHVIILTQISLSEPGSHILPRTTYDMPNV